MAAASLHVLAMDVDGLTSLVSPLNLGPLEVVLLNLRRVAVPVGDHLEFA